MVAVEGVPLNPNLTYLFKGLQKEAKMNPQNGRYYRVEVALRVQVSTNNHMFTLILSYLTTILNPST